MTEMPVELAIVWNIDFDEPTAPTRKPAMPSSARDGSLPRLRRPSPNCSVRPVDVSQSRGDPLGRPP